MRFDFVVVTALEPDASVPGAEVRLHPNYPNPVRAATTFEYDLPRPMPVTLAVYDLLGRRVALLAENRIEYPEILLAAGRLGAIVA